jgi:AraC-like DNA-binding protein
MDEIEGGILAQIPPSALTLTLTRSTIRMQHSASWSIDKVNPVHDLLVGLTGEGHYLVDGRLEVLRPGEAMLIPRNTRFVGWNPGAETYTGIAQHFTLDIYGTHDLLSQMDLRPRVALPRWDVLGPLVRQFRQTAPPSSVTLAQHHAFMLILIAYVEAAFVAWRDQRAFVPDRPDQIALSVMVAATRIAADPLAPGIAEAVVADAPYNRDYFLRAFRTRVGRTPRQFQEFRRMERAMHLLESGASVGTAAAEVGYADPYYFSRMFKRIMGLSPRAHMARVQHSRDGSLLHLDELAQIQALHAANARTGAPPGPSPEPQPAGIGRR